MDTKELETLDPLHYSLIDFNGGLFGPPFPVVHDHLLCLAHIEGEVVVLAPHGQVSDLLFIDCLVVVGDQIVLESRLATQSWVNREYSVEDQCGRCVVAYPYHLGLAHLEVQDPVAEGGV